MAQRKIKINKITILKFKKYSFKMKKAIDKTGNTNVQYTKM